MARLSPELSKSFDEIMAVASDVRGRALLYPYRIGAGQRCGWWNWSMAR
ncbi:MAG: hypothetical protein R3B46_03110 [Phycisphaerales bacterium]